MNKIYMSTVKYFDDWSLAIRAAARGLPLIALLTSIALGQQGWSRINTIQKNGQPATINAVAFDGDTVWVVGAEGLLMRSVDEGKTFEEVLIKTSDGLNDV